MHPMTSGNIRCRENKVYLLTHADQTAWELPSMIMPTLVNRVVNVSAMTNHRGFFVLTKGH